MNQVISVSLEDCDSDSDSDYKDCAVCSEEDSEDEVDSESSDLLCEDCKRELYNQNHYEQSKCKSYERLSEKSAKTHDKSNHKFHEQRGSNLCSCKIKASHQQKELSSCERGGNQKCCEDFSGKHEANHRHKESKSSERRMDPKRCDYSESNERRGNPRYERDSSFYEDKAILKCSQEKISKITEGKSNRPCQDINSYAHRENQKCYQRKDSNPCTCTPSQIYQEWDSHEHCTNENKCYPKEQESHPSEPRSRQYRHDKFIPYEHSGNENKCSPEKEPKSCEHRAWNQEEKKVSCNREINEKYHHENDSKTCKRKTNRKSCKQKSPKSYDVRGNQKCSEMKRSKSHECNTKQIYPVNKQSRSHDRVPHVDKIAHDTSRPKQRVDCEGKNMSNFDSNCHRSSQPLDKSKWPVCNKCKKRKDPHRKKKCSTPCNKDSGGYFDLSSALQQLQNYICPEDERKLNYSNNESKCNNSKPKKFKFFNSSENDVKPYKQNEYSDRSHRHDASNNCSNTNNDPNKHQEASSYCEQRGRTKICHGNSKKKRDNENVGKSVTSSKSNETYNTNKWKSNGDYCESDCGIINQDEYKGSHSTKNEICNKQNMNFRKKSSQSICDSRVPNSCYASECQCSVQKSHQPSFRGKRPNAPLSCENVSKCVSQACQTEFRCKYLCKSDHSLYDQRTQTERLEILCEPNRKSKPSPRPKVTEDSNRMNKHKRSKQSPYYLSPRHSSNSSSLGSSSSSVCKLIISPPVRSDTKHEEEASCDTIKEKEMFPVDEYKPKNARPRERKFYICENDKVSKCFLKKEKRIDFESDNETSSNRQFNKEFEKLSMNLKAEKTRNCKNIKPNRACYKLKSKIDKYCKQTCDSKRQ
ncbi:axoneme-associated protein mst101(2)-like isoform X1 [Diaphorina citri]|uniref:Axoneme-associated protein mst101(2)-like isoform X1 n=1 Tax=Diaphorina citri TaxID=121845 RepID=A0A3Q0IR01_DIACI|nr:axoneme-associated protein mst101(2)-like isoform X1 [Diaphorina citri]